MPLFQSLAVVAALESTDEMLANIEPEVRTRTNAHAFFLFFLFLPGLEKVPVDIGRGDQVGVKTCAGKNRVGHEKHNEHRPCTNRPQNTQDDTDHVRKNIHEKPRRREKLASLRVMRDAPP